jgi:hypothetical protein
MVKDLNHNNNNNKVMTDAEQIEQWRDFFLADMDSLVATGKKPVRMKRSKGKRILGWVTCSIGCLPCEIWSIATRLLLCPFICLTKGPGGICDQNGCSVPSDTMIASCIEVLELDKTVKTSDLLEQGAFATPDSSIDKSFERVQAVRDAVIQVLRKGMLILRDEGIEIRKRSLVADEVARVVMLLGRKEVMLMSPLALATFIRTNYCKDNI